MSNPILWTDPETGTAYYPAILWTLHEEDDGFAEGFRFQVELFDGDYFRFRSLNRAKSFFDDHALMQISAVEMVKLREETAASE
jgi:hypothetical protein